MATIAVYEDFYLTEGVYEPASGQDVTGWRYVKIIGYDEDSWIVMNVWVDQKKYSICVVLFDFLTELC